VSASCEFVLIHDSARPFIEKKDVENLLLEGMDVGAATLATPVKNTIKSVDQNHHVQQTLKRECLYEIQTPQLLKKDLLKTGLHVARSRNLHFTDDVSLAELVNHPVKIVMGSDKNIKITTPKDLHYAQSI